MHPSIHPPVLVKTGKIIAYLVELILTTRKDSDSIISVCYYLIPGISILRSTIGLQGSLFIVWVVFGMQVPRILSTATVVYCNSSLLQQYEYISILLLWLLWLLSDNVLSLAWASALTTHKYHTHYYPKEEYQRKTKQCEKDTKMRKV